MKNILIILLIGSIFSSSGCYKENESDTQFNDEFYLSHKGADLPIWVRGNKSAKTFILFLHGGPYDNALFNAVSGHFEPLYDDYAIVFFDQRGGGFAHGGQVNISPEQFVEDVEVVLTLIKQKYSTAESIFLMGHSWGGYLGTDVLATKNNQDLFNGWIELAGNHNFPLNWVESRDFSMNICREKISEGVEDIEIWEERLEALQNTPEVTNTMELRIVNGIAFQIARDINAGTRTFEDPSFLFLATSPIGAGFGQHNLEELDDIRFRGNLNPVMPNITLPSLLIYGGQDPIVPPALGSNGYDFLGTPEEDKYLVVLSNSGHCLWEYQADIFFDQVSSFINKYE